MDRRDAMTFSGSAPYYIQRGVTSGGTGLQGSPTIYPLSGGNAAFQPNPVGSSIGSTLPVEPSSTLSVRGVNVGAPSTVTQAEPPVRRKRGRPRKYGPDGKVSLSLSPVSSTPPLPTTSGSQKRGRGRPPGTGRKQQLASLGNGGWPSSTAGIGFTPHVITISIGEDIATKIMSFSQQGPRAICILSANGAISTVTLRQPSSFGGTVTYEGRFEILCLSGSYLLTANTGSHSRSGGLSVSLASPDGRVIGGGVGGVLIAATPVQVIVGSFLCSGSSKTKQKVGQRVGSAVDSDDQIVDNPITITSFPQSQNLTSTSSMATWLGSQHMDVQTAHADIDLMHG